MSQGLGDNYIWVTDENGNGYYIEDKTPWWAGNVSQVIDAVSRRRTTPQPQQYPGYYPGQPSQPGGGINLGANVSGNGLQLSTPLLLAGAAVLLLLMTGKRR